MGLLAKVALILGGSENLPLQALVILVALVGLAILLTSDRLRQNLQHAISRHLHRPLHDYRSLWTLFAERTASLVTREDFCREVVKLTSLASVIGLLVAFARISHLAPLVWLAE